MSWQILQGDVRDVLKTLPDQSVQCVVTSPPYWGLRDYGVDGQIGLESTPDAFVAELVAVFAEVRRVLKDDGVVWLNLGDSYAANQGGAHGPNSSVYRAKLGGKTNQKCAGVPDGLKPKDLVGVPWLVAKALQSPYYSGRIQSERDRAWLGGIIDGEGTICGFHHVRSDTGDPRTGVHVFVTNGNQALLDECAAIWPASRSEHARAGEGHLGGDCWRWICHGTENKILLLRELYPYVRTKRLQALVAYNLLLLMREAKRLGKTQQMQAIREKRRVMTEWLSDLNHRRQVDLPGWLEEPPATTGPGWYLRSDIIWHKPNPMPESVTDRPTKSHEYIFLLSKSERYYYDAAAIAEPVSDAMLQQMQDGYDGKGTKDYEGAGVQNPSIVKSRIISKAKQRKGDVSPRNDGNGWNSNDGRGFPFNGLTRNARSVWEINTQPYPEAHFATFPEALPERCIKAGSRVGDVVLDPFCGAGTTGLVADRLGRDFIGIELNPAYRELARKRIGSVTPLFPNEASA